MGAGGKREAQAQRTFCDVTGQRWAVAEHRIPAAEWTAADEESSRAGFGVGWLWFTSDAGSRRRLRLYPSWWERMSDDALEGLRSRAREASAGTA